jgi:hypothetical protein
MPLHRRGVRQCSVWPQGRSTIDAAANLQKKNSSKKKKQQPAVTRHYLTETYSAIFL